MICAACGEPTDVRPCGGCGASPLLAGRYALTSVLGRGAYGTTWRAEGPVGVVAIKELPLHAGTDSKTRQLFTREARVLRELDHPCIPRYLDDFEVRAGRHRTLCIVQELVDGPSLQEELRSHRYDSGEVLEVLARLLPVLVYLHELSPPVVHRDLKPGNVLRAADGRLVLVDFGAVRDVLKDPDLGGSTLAAGTFGYMAPEQLVGDASARSDLYGLGALAIALLTRREPHTMLDASHRLQWRTHAEVAPGLGVLLDRLLEPDPAARPASARAVLRDVEALQAARRRGHETPALALEDLGFSDDRTAETAGARITPGPAPERLREPGLDELLQPDIPELPARPRPRAPSTTAAPAAGAAWMTMIFVAVAAMLAVVALVAALALMPTVGVAALETPAPVVAVPAPPLPVPPVPVPPAVAPPAPADAVGLAVVGLSGDGEGWLVDTHGRSFQLPSVVPAGEYQMQARFEGTKKVDQGRLTVTAGHEFDIHCNQLMRRCRLP